MKGGENNMMKDKVKTYVSNNGYGALFMIIVRDMLRRQSVAEKKGMKNTVKRYTKAIKKALTVQALFS